MEKFFSLYSDPSILKPKNVTNDEWNFFLNNLYSVNNCENLLVYISKKGEIQFFFRNSLE